MINGRFGSIAAKQTFYPWQRYVYYFAIACPLDCLHKTIDSVCLTLIIMDIGPYYRQECSILLHMPDRPNLQDGKLRGTLEENGSRVGTATGTPQNLGSTKEVKEEQKANNKGLTTASPERTNRVPVQNYSASSVGHGGQYSITLMILLAE